GSVDLPTGVAHLQMLGVRYYMVSSPNVEAQAAADPDLQLIASTGPWPVAYSSGTQNRTWQVYLVRNSAEVAPLDYEPAVLTHQGTSAAQWLKTSVAWYQDPGRWSVPLAESGPSSWPRVDARSPNPPKVPVPAARVSNVHTSDDRISFDVDRTGSPVVVRTSYFPNWQASGASGPYRITPNLMVVVPTSHHVELHYGWTPVDGLGWLATALGVVGLIWLSRRPPFPAEPAHDRAPSGDELPPAHDDEAELVGVGAGGWYGADGDEAGGAPPPP
ncbi:MAG TPA: hypothetical protein VFH45_13750, partial [Acidimicrobiales bacterium]|nr:hypothetical protein [Acidimicrobiales bacterium]